jgi:uncharacterized repeat protein (TIGR01451 family)
MTIKNKLLTSAAIASLSMTGSVFAATGGGATIHNAASLTFSGGQVTDSVDVEVATIGTLPTITSVDVDANAGETVNVTYTLTSTSNGVDTYTLDVSTNDTNISAPDSSSVNPTSVILGASITSASSVTGTPDGAIRIPAGSETGLTVGDTVLLAGGKYTISAVTLGSVASTTGNTTTAEVATRIFLTPIGAAPAIIAGNIAAGTQVGEYKDIVVTVVAGNPTTPGTDGSHEIGLEVTAAELDGAGGVVTTTNTSGSTITVLSGNGTLIKEVRNETTNSGGAYATSGVTARTGDVLEYRLTVGTVGTTSPADDLTAAVLADTIPPYTSYVPNSTTLNSNAVADPSAGVSPLEGAGMSVDSDGTAGEVVAGNTAVVIFQVTVE